MTETTAERREAWRAPLPGIWALVLVAAAAMAIALAFFISMSVAALALVGAGTGLVAMGVAFWVYKALRGLRQRAWLGTVRDLVTSDPWPSVLTNADGRIIHANEAVTEMLGAGRGNSLSDVLAEEMVAADALVERLLAGTTDRSHSALETVHVDRADIAVSAQRLADNVVLWRMKITTLDAEAFDGALGLPVVSGSPLTGWLPRNAPARAALTDAPPRVSTGPPEIAGHVATPLMQSADVETVIYLPKHRATLSGEASAAVEDIATLDSLIAGLPVPFVRIETEGKVAAANAPARRLLGLDAGEVPPLYQIVEGLGRSVNDWLKDATEARGLLKPEFVRATLPEA
ncbi:MAG: PAS domain-containing protein, partial [Pseudomonadota bacterium]